LATKGLFQERASWYSDGIKRVNHFIRGEHWNEVLFLEIRIVTPDTRITSKGTGNVQYVVRVGATYCFVSLADVFIELTGWNRFDVLEEQLDELLYSALIQS